MLLSADSWSCGWDESVTLDAAGAIGGVECEDGGDDEGWSAAWGDAAASLGAARGEVAGAGVVPAAMLQALGVFGTGLEGSAGQALKPAGSEEAPKSTGSPLPLAHEAPGPDPGHCFEPSGTTTLATAGCGRSAAPATHVPWLAIEPPHSMPRMSCDAVVALGWSLPAILPAEPVAAARATIWLVIEIRASRMAVAVRGLRPRETGCVDDSKFFLPMHGPRWDGLTGGKLLAVWLPRSGCLVNYLERMSNAPIERRN